MAYGTGCIRVNLETNYGWPAVSCDQFSICRLTGLTLPPDKENNSIDENKTNRKKEVK